MTNNKYNYIKCFIILLVFCLIGTTISQAKPNEDLSDNNNISYPSYLKPGDFVFMELIKNRSLTPGKNLFFYRDQNGVEIDLLWKLKTD